MIELFLSEDEQHLHAAHTTLFQERFAAVATRHGYAPMSDHTLPSHSSGLEHDGEEIPLQHELGRSKRTTGVSVHSVMVKCQTINIIAITPFS